MIDQDIVTRFVNLCSKNFENEDFGSTSQPYHVHEGNRNWHPGNLIGAHEKAALHAVGFKTSGHRLTKEGYIADIDAFWTAQRKFDQNLWSVTMEKPNRRWIRLWKHVVPQIVSLTWMDIRRVSTCKYHLQEVVRLRKVEFSKKVKTSTHDPIMAAKLNRNHWDMTEAIKKCIEEIEVIISTTNASTTASLPVTSVFVSSSGGGSK